jgi:3-deoxy-D-manno-octulosonate 8-phosphate phosphatase (KDO 8-P phosphatase)
MQQKVEKIKCVICDVDGVMTNGSLYYDNAGNELKAFHVHDGVGLKLLMSAGIEVAVITTSVSKLVDLRMRDLGIQHYLKGQLNKENAFKALKTKLQLDFENFAYIGDDLPDLPIIKQVGFGVAVANAASEVKKHADFQTKNEGGQGAVREVCDLILMVQNKSDMALERYLGS